MDRASFMVENLPREKRVDRRHNLVRREHYTFADGRRRAHRLSEALHATKPTSRTFEPNLRPWRRRGSLSGGLAQSRPRRWQMRPPCRGRNKSRLCSRARCGFNSCDFASDILLRLVPPFMAQRFFVSRTQLRPSFCQLSLTISRRALSL
jgi:hypothetical protein